FRLYNTNTIELNSEVAGIIFNFGPISQQHRNSEPPSGELAGGLENTGILTLRKGDTFRVSLKFLQYAVNQHGWLISIPSADQFSRLTARKSGRGGRFC